MGTLKSNWCLFRNGGGEGQDRIPYTAFVCRVLEGEGSGAEEDMVVFVFPSVAGAVPIFNKST
jgi:hypothetical protein